MALNEKLGKIQERDVDLGRGFENQRRMYEALREKGLTKRPEPLTVPRPESSSARMSPWRPLRRAGD